jgi:hypothetical protein
MVFRNQIFNGPNEIKLVENILFTNWVAENSIE